MNLGFFSNFSLSSCGCQLRVVASGVWYLCILRDKENKGYVLRLRIVEQFEYYINLVLTQWALVACFQGIAIIHVYGRCVGIYRMTIFGPFMYRLSFKCHGKIDACIKRISAYLYACGSHSVYMVNVPFRVFLEFFNSFGHTQFKFK